jgi:ATP-dependent DNA helicase RecG
VLYELEQPVTALKGVGPKLADTLAKLGIHRIADMLFHLPLRYQDRTRITPIRQLRLGQDYLIEGRVVKTQVMFGKQRTLLCTLEDDSGAIALRFFHFAKQQENALYKGRLLRCYGEIRQGKNGAEMAHPELQYDPNPAEAMPDALTPVYPSTENLSQGLWRKLQAQAMEVLRNSNAHLALLDLSLLNLPPQLNIAHVSLKDALLYLHQPPANADIHAIHEGRHPYQQRLAFEELLAHQLSLLKLRAIRQQFQAPFFPAQCNLAQQLEQSLPFALTAAQQNVLADIRADVASRLPMMRLVQGDVGSGKTVVAAIAAAHAVAAGYQVAIMAPTEILAEQHKDSFSQWFAPLAIKTGWLVGRHTSKQKNEIMAELGRGDIHVVLGTHALFQEGVEFKRLGLVIIDEQHRFGVHQRLALRDKGIAGQEVPHQLIMTATPIPRTLAMTAYADLDLSVIDELPPGRKPINTIAIEQHRRAQVIERIKAACEQGHQAYWVCTLIEESETLNCQAAEKTAHVLQDELQGLRVGLVHGRLTPKEKAATMQLFSIGQLDVLVATTVIEVGVNVPNASLMVIENPERLGLAQLHQLRGRVGRGSAQSFCVLLYQAPLSLNATERINILRESNDGFVIAETDLKLRGPGEVLGSRQTGVLQFRIADIERDSDLLPLVNRYARELYATYPDTGTALISRWITNADYYAQG